MRPRVAAASYQLDPDDSALGLFAALLVVIGIRTFSVAEAFRALGLALPFLSRWLCSPSRWIG